MDNKLKTTIDDSVGHITLNARVPKFFKLDLSEMTIDDLVDMVKNLKNLNITISEEHWLNKIVLNKFKREVKK